jgi:hypothetical protein
MAHALVANTPSSLVVADALLELGASVDEPAEFKEYATYPSKEYKVERRQPLYITADNNDETRFAAILAKHPAPNNRQNDDRVPIFSYLVGLRRWNLVSTYVRLCHERGFWLERAELDGAYTRAKSQDQSTDLLYCLASASASIPVGCKR